MTARRCIFISATMQASCRAHIALAFLSLFTVFCPPAASLAADRYADLPRDTSPKKQIHGYSPAFEAQVRADREKRKSLAEERIKQALGHAPQPPVAANPPPQTLIPATPPLTARAAVVPPPPTPVFVDVAAETPTPPSPTPTATPPVATEVSDVAPAALKELPKLDEPSTEPSTSLLAPPWHTASDAEALASPPPPPPLAAEPVVIEHVPAPRPDEGIVADKTYIIAPGMTAPPSSAPLSVPQEPEVPVLPEVAAAIEATQTEAPPTETLSPETEEILDALPVDIIGRPTPKGEPKEFNLNRTDPDIKLPEIEGEATESSETLGMKVAVKKRSMDVNYELEKAYIALTGGDTQQAIAIYKNVLEITPDNEQALFGLATTYHRVGLLEEARPIYGTLLKKYPRNKDAINNFLVLVGEEAPERALEHMKHLEMDNPEFAPIPAQMALLYGKLGDMPSAIQSMQRAVTISPENLVYKYNLAILYDKAQKPVEASILYKQLLEARYRGEPLPADADQIQQRLTFLLSNK